MEFIYSENNIGKCINHIEKFCNESKENILKIIGVGCDIREHFYDSLAKKYLFKNEKKTIELEIILLNNAINLFFPVSFQLSALSLDSNKHNSYDIIYFCCAMNGDKDDIFKYIRYAKQLLKTKNSNLIILDNENKKIITESGFKSLGDFIKQDTGFEFRYVHNETTDKCFF